MEDVVLLTSADCGRVLDLGARGVEVINKDSEGGEGAAAIVE